MCPQAVTAHPLVLKPLLTFFHLPQKVAGHRVLSHCVLLNTKERFDTGLKLLSSYFPEHPFVLGLSTGGCEEQTIKDESFTCIQR